MVKQSEFFAERLMKATSVPAKRIEIAYELAFGRSPNADEMTALLGYAKKHGLANTCRVLYNANEFVFVD
jgi:hypothetical protein